MAHYYTAEGRAPQMVPYAGNRPGQRKATLRDAKANGWAPGVTDVIRMLNAEGLNTWRVREAIKLVQSICRENPAMLALTPEALVAEVESREDTSKRDIGTEIHADIERAVRGERYGNADIVDAVSAALRKRWPTASWHEEYPCFGDWPGLPFGGTIDLYAPGIVVDIKTKESLDGRLQWDEHVMQLAAYCKATGAGIAANLFVDYTGAVEIVEVNDEDLNRGLRLFRAAREVYFLRKGL
jgi:hypothetical protein